MAEEDQPSDTEARHPGARAILTVDERIEHIVGMMERFEWVRGKSAPVLAAEWDLAVNTVEKHAAEASRRCTGDADEARRDISIGARKLIRQAIEAGDDKAFRNVSDVWAMVSGAKAADKIQVGGLDNVTPGKAREVMAELFGAVTPDAKPSDPER